MTNPLGYYSGYTQPAPQGQWVMADHPCRRCGANLRGQSFGARCPQCGTPVGQSLYGDLLNYADTSWLARVRTGLSTFLWGSILMVVAFVLLLGGLMVSAFSMAGRMSPQQQRSSTTSLPPELEWFVPAAGLVAVIFGIVLLYATWMITSPDPGGADEEKNRTLRSMVRGGSIAWIAVALINFTVVVTKAFPVDDPVAIGGSLLGTLLQAAVTITFGLYLGNLASRSPAPDLTGRFRTAAWALGLGGLVTAVLQLGILAMGGPNSSPDAGSMAVGCFNGLVGLTVIVFAVIFLVAIGQLGGKFRTAMQYSQAIWSQPFGATAGSAMSQQPPQPQPPPTM